MKLAVFVGPRGRGSNLMALHTATQEGRLSAQIVVVIGTKATAPALERAQQAGLSTAVIDLTGKEEAACAHLLGSTLQEAGADTIALAGYLRRLPSAIVNAYPHRIINIHPSLLPAFGGKGMYGENVHRAVLEYGAKVSGCTAHLVDETYDTGPVILQRVVTVEEGDTPETLAARVLPQEHAAFVEALQLLAEGRLSVEGRVVHVREKRTD
jgi:phosphoribosylglycinamide formyltransferase-1